MLKFKVTKTERERERERETETDRQTDRQTDRDNPFKSAGCNYTESESIGIKHAVVYWVLITQH